LSQHFIRLWPRQSETSEGNTPGKISQFVESPADGLGMFKQRSAVKQRVVRFGTVFKKRLNVSTLIWRTVCAPQHNASPTVRQAEIAGLLRIPPRKGFTNRKPEGLVCVLNHRSPLTGSMLNISMNRAESVGDVTKKSIGKSYQRNCNKDYSSFSTAAEWRKVSIARQREITFHHKAGFTAGQLVVRTSTISVHQPMRRAIIHKRWNDRNRLEISLKPSRCKMEQARRLPQQDERFI